MSELNMYSGEPQHNAFAAMGEFFPTAEMKASSQPHHFADGSLITLPDTYEFDTATKSTAEFINDTDTSALLVIQNGAVRYESYRLTGGRETPWVSWSVAKSFISALVGIALHEGAINSIETPISDYAQALKGSGYDGVSIKHVLQMSSGARWNEDYSDPDADVHHLGAVMAGDSTLTDFVASIEPNTTPGTHCQYNSADTQALGMLLRAATGRSITDYMHEKLSEPMGFESTGFWLTDHVGEELVLGGLNLTARDFAKLGELYRNNGLWNGQQLVPEAWVLASTKSQEPHLQPGKVIVGGHIFPFGYAYQWWVPAGPAGNEGEYSAIGVYNQFIYVNPTRELVIVKLSANRTYGTTPHEAENQEGETMEFLRAIARSC